MKPQGGVGVGYSRNPKSAPPLARTSYGEGEDTRTIDEMIFIKRVVLGTTGRRRKPRRSRKQRAGQNLAPTVCVERRGGLKCDSFFSVL